MWCNVVGLAIEATVTIERTINQVPEWNRNMQIFIIKNVLHLVHGRRTRGSHKRAGSRCCGKIPNLLDWTPETLLVVTCGGRESMPCAVKPTLGETLM